MAIVKQPATTTVIAVSTPSTTHSATMDSANITINERPIVKRTNDPISKRLFASSPPPIVRQSRKRYFEVVEDEQLSLPKKIAGLETSPITPAVSSHVKSASPSLVMSISPPTKSKPPIYDFDEATVNTPDDDAFQSNTQRSPIIINTASPRGSVV